MGQSKLCGKHQAEYASWQQTTADLGTRYNPDRGHVVLNQDPVEIRRLHTDNRRELVRKQLGLITKSCRAGKRCGTKEQAFT